MSDVGIITVARIGDKTLVTRADPRAIIAAELLFDPLECLTVDQDKLIIKDDFDQEFVYELGNYDALYDVFHLRRIDD